MQQPVLCLEQRPAPLGAVRMPCNRRCWRRCRCRRRRRRRYHRTRLHGLAALPATRCCYAAVLLPTPPLDPALALASAPAPAPFWSCSCSNANPNPPSTKQQPGAGAGAGAGVGAGAGAADGAGAASASSAYPARTPGAAPPPTPVEPRQPPPAMHRVKLCSRLRRHCPFHSEPGATPRSLPIMANPDYHTTRATRTRHLLRACAARRAL
jgi:hypothetical protein